MDRARKKANNLSGRRIELIDLGSLTPPQIPPPCYFQDSAIRYTQTPEEANRADCPQSPGYRSVPQLDATAHSSKTNKTPKSHTTQPVESTTYNRVYAEKSADSVYLINAKAGSWSGTLPSEDDPAARDTLPYQAIEKLKQMKAAQEAEKSLHSPRATDHAAKLTSATETDQQRSETRKVDLYLRKVMRNIKKNLNNGGVLILERQTVSNKCSMALCPSTDQGIPPGSYCVTLKNPKDRYETSVTCFTCLEKLWDGVGMLEPLPDAQIEDVEVQTAPSISGLDGVSDEPMVNRRLAAAGLTNGVPSTSTIPIVTRTTRPPTTQHSSPSTMNIAKASDGPISSHVMSKQPTVLPISPPSSRKISVREAQDLSLGFSEAFLDGQVKVAKRRSELHSGSQLNTQARRSARINTALRDQAPVKPATPASPTIALTAALNAVHISKRVNIDAMADNIAKAESKLRQMYNQRDKIASSLEPGERAVVQLRKTVKENPDSRHVSVDAFGIQYTDLLSEHVKYTAAIQREEVKTTLPLHSRSKASSAECTSQSKPSEYMDSQADHWCSCHGIDDGSEMIKCANEKCLIGWFHVDCVLDYVSEIGDEDWYCSLCSSTHLGTQNPVINPSVNDELIEALFPPSYAEQATKQPYGLGAPLGTIQYRQTYHVDDDEDTATEYFDAMSVQLDGTSDSPDTKGEISDSPSSSSVAKDIPGSLLTSKHAPAPEDLESFLTSRPFTRSNSPSPSDIDSPGSPTTPNASKASSETMKGDSPSLSDGDLPEMPGNSRSSRASSLTLRGDTPRPSDKGLPETTGSPCSPEESFTTITGESPPSPIRFQHLARYLRAGAGLNPTEIAAFKVWKAASKDQLNWQKLQGVADLFEDVFREPLRGEEVALLRAKRTAKHGAESLTGYDQNQDEGFDKSLVIAEMSKDECYGMDLTEVFAEMSAEVRRRLKCSK